MAKKLGYGQPTGLDLGREISGYLPDSKSITPESGSARAHAINASIGQGEINVTPLQQAVAYAAIANGGTGWEPPTIQRLPSPDRQGLEKVKAPPDPNKRGRGKPGAEPEYPSAPPAGPSPRAHQ